MKHLVVIILLAISSITVEAQELQCAVSVVHRQIQGTNTSVFKTLENSITEFMNGRKWTDDAFNPNERITCNILINLSEHEGTQFQGSITIQARRPIHGSSYNTSLINYRDNDFTFNYTEFESLNFNENTFDSNLTSILAFYAYYILALDYDSFSPSGGTAFYRLTEKIVNNAQNTTSKGWKPLENNKNRYWMAEQAMHSDFKNYRKFYYDYHRQGLDMMSKSSDEGLKKTTNALALLESVQQLRPASITLQILFDSKYDEIVQMLEKAAPSTKEEMARLLKRIDPGHTQNYNSITQ